MRGKQNLLQVYIKVDSMLRFPIILFFFFLYINIFFIASDKAKRARERDGGRLNVIFTHSGIAPLFLGSGYRKQGSFFFFFILIMPFFIFASACVFVFPPSLLVDHFSRISSVAAPFSSSFYYLARCFFL